MQLLKRLLRWPLWGVLLTGTASSLVVLRTELFGGHYVLALLSYIGLPVLGGVLTPEKPAYTVLVFGVGSFSLFWAWVNDLPRIPFGLWPFLWAYDVVRNGHITWQTILFYLPSVLLISSGIIFGNALGIVPQVYLGWAIRGWLLSKWPLTRDRTGGSTAHSHRPDFPSELPRDPAST